MSQEHQKAIIGNLDHDYWVWDSEKGFDLTRTFKPEAKVLNKAVTLTTTKADVKIDPAISALVVIDMQNFFLSTALGRPADSKGLQTERQLLDHAIPAARKAGIQIIWVNWGLTDEDLASLPPAEHRAFGFNAIPATEFDHLFSAKSVGTTGNSAQAGTGHNDLGKNARIYKGLGHSLGTVDLPDGSVVDAGRMLMREQWNTELSPPLQNSCQSSLKSSKPDVILDKARISGLHTASTPAGEYLRSNGFKTLIFGGVNTDQCVNGTLTDAFCQGYDCILLSDGCATTSPKGAQECVEHNVGNIMGFALTCEDFANGVEKSSDSV